MIVLVTGGAGFIGSALVRHLVESTDARVVNVDALTYAGSPSRVAACASSPRYAFEQVDVRDGAALEAVLERHRPDAVVHLAAESHVDRSIERPADFIGTNVVGTATLLDVALRYWRGLAADARSAFRFLHVSTDEVYGSLALDAPAFAETTPYDPSSPYAASKAGADHLVQAWQRTYGLPALISNCSNNYGPWQFPEKLIPLAITKAVRAEPIPVYGRGENVRDWLHVDDHVGALLAILAHGRVGARYNVGGHGERSNLDLVRDLCDLLDELRPDGPGAPHRDLIRFVTDRPGHDLRYAIDPDRIERELDWRPSIPLDAGLRDTVRWYLDNLEWCDAVTEGRYRGERLGLPA